MSGSLVQAGHVAAPLYFISFVLVTFVALHILLAIITIHFALAREQVTQHTFRTYVRQNQPCG